MRAWRAILGRETGAFFHGGLAPVVLAAFLGATGFAWANAVLYYAELSQSAITTGQVLSDALNLHDGIYQPLFQGMTLTLLLLMPAITMRLFAEEYRSRRADLILTWPVPDVVWVTGKWSAAVATGLLLVVAGAPLLIASAFLGRPEAGSLLASALGLVLTAAMAASWGVAASSVATHQAVAWLLGFAVTLGAQMVGEAEPYLPGALGDWAVRLSLPEHLGRFTRGILDLADVVYFLGGIALGLTVTVLVVTGRRLASARRPARWLPAAALLLLVVLANLAAEKASLRLDLTPEQRWSLAPRTVQVLENLREDVEVTAFFQRLDPDRREVERLLQAFAEHGPRLRFRMLNPDVDLAAVRDLEVQDPRTIVLEAGGRRRMLQTKDEGRLVSEIDLVARGERDVIYCLTGHGEKDLMAKDRDGFSAFARILRGEGYELRNLALSVHPVIPQDAKLVVVAAPRQDPTVPELMALHGYMARGGAVMVLLAPGAPSQVREWVAIYNVGVDDDFVVRADVAGSTFDRRVMVLNSYTPHPIVKELEGVTTVLPFAQSLHAVRKGFKGLEGKTILVAQGDVWGETNLEQIQEGTMVFDEGEDLSGSLALGVAMTVNLEEFFDEGRLSRITGSSVSPKPTGGTFYDQSTESRLVVVGNVDFAVNAHVQLFGNRDLLLNMVEWLVEDEVTPAIGTRDREGGAQPLLLDDAQRRRLWLGALGWPLLATLLVVGWLWRRSRR